MTGKCCRVKRWFPPEEFYAEEVCTRCGVCCGSTDGHPCEHLRRDAAGAYFCEVYSERFGPHRTVDGYAFDCVPIKAVIEATGGYAKCAYVEEIRRVRESMGRPTSDLGRRTKP